MNKKKITPALLSGMMTISMGTTPISVLAQEEQPQEINETNVEKVNEPVSTEENEITVNTNSDSQNTSLEQPKEAEESNDNSNTKTTTSTETNKEIVQENTVNPLAENVASVTTDGVTTYYASFKEALEYANGKTATVTLLQDTYESGSNLVFLDGNITLVGNGFTATASYLEIEVEGILTVENGNWGDGIALYCCPTGTIYLEGGNYDYVSFDYNGGTIYLNGGFADSINASNLGTLYISGGSYGSLSNVTPIYTPEFSVLIDSVSAGKITVKPLENQALFGAAQYSLDGQNWQTSNEFNNLKPNTTYTIYAKYDNAPNIIKQTTVTTTMADGADIITEPSNLAAIYGQKLSDISLPEGWTWVNGDTSVSVGKQTYTARFDTTNYENEYDFSNVNGYIKDAHYVERILTVNVSKANTTLIITTDNMDKSYDGNAVAEPSVNKTGSTKEVTFTWYIKNGDNWKEITSAPTDAGSYKVIAKVEADNNYNGAETPKEFSISQTTNEWTEELSITGWTYGEEAKTPTAKAKYGDVNFTYSDKENGTYTDTVPTNAGIWYVKATVEGNQNYTGLEAIKEFTISKADSSIGFKEDFNLDKTYDTKAVSITADDVETSGSQGHISFSYEKKVGESWEPLSEAPTGAGTYRVTATLSGDNNYNSATSEALEFTINKADTVLKFTVDDLDKVYDGKAVNAPTKQSGNSHVRVLNWYQLDEDGTWTKLEEAPVNAGSYKVVASVEPDDNYNGIEIEMTFEITKAVPSYTIPENLIIRQGDVLSTVSLPEGFTWKDATQTADTLGTQMFKATFTPTDTTNYQTVDVDITVDVVPVTTPVNQPPVINAKDQTLTVGDKFDPMKGVTATDKEDGDLTDKIVITKNTVDTSKAGKYTIDYEVTDNGGTRVRKTIVVTVKEQATTSDEENKPDTDKKTPSKDTAQTSTQTNVLAWTLLGLASAGAFITGLFKRKHQ